MTVKEAISIFKEKRYSILKEKTKSSYNYLLRQFEDLFEERLFDSINSEDVYQFLEILTDNSDKSTRRLRYAQTKAFFNFIIEEFSLHIVNPCNASTLTKAFRCQNRKTRHILDKETVDELIYNTNDTRDRLMLELQARCGLRIGEVLSLRVSDIFDRKIIIREPKSGRDEEVAFMPEHIANRLNDFIKRENLSPHDRLFPMCYTTARSLIRRIGKKLNIQVTPHDFRRHSATFASRNGVPLEIISKVILRHRDIKTTQVYLGKISDSEAIRWMDVLHGK